MKVKLIALFLALIFLFTCGCGNENVTEEEAPDRILFTANGAEVTEDFFRYFVYYYKTELESVYGVITDWNAELQDGMTYWEYVKHMAEEWFLYAGAVRAQLIRLGIEITEEDLSAVEENWTALCENYGGEEAAITALEESHCSKEMYKYIVETNVLTEKCFAHMYGLDGSKVSDEDCADKTAEDGYYMTKHILILTSKTDEAGNTVALTEEEKTDALKKAESIVTLLDQCAPEEVESRFDELMYSFTEDPGIAAFPDGYLFQEGDMVDEYFNGTTALEIGEYSGVVESSHGYHIILRLPVNYDVVPMSHSDYLNYGYDYYTLRYIVAEEMFQANLNSWIDLVEVSYEEAYDNIDMETFLAFG